MTGPRPHARSRWHSLTCTSPCSTWDSVMSRPCSSIASHHASFGSDTSCISPGDLAGNISVSRICGAMASPAIFRSCSSGSRSGDSLPLARQLLKAQEYWRVKGLRADVVILNEHPADYLDEMQNLLASLVQQPPWVGWLGKPGGHLPVASRWHARIGPAALLRGCQSRAPRRPWRSRLATRATGILALRRA